jgi:hypothetical protein
MECEGPVMAPWHERMPGAVVPDLDVPLTSELCSLQRGSYLRQASRAGGPGVRGKKRVADERPVSWCIHAAGARNFVASRVMQLLAECPGTSLASAGGAPGVFQHCSLGLVELHCRGEHLQACGDCGTAVRVSRCGITGGHEAVAQLEPVKTCQSCGGTGLPLGVWHMAGAAQSCESAV